jgi:hypothetical protein
MQQIYETKKPLKIKIAALFQISRIMHQKIDVSRVNIGIICARRTPSKACFRWFVTGRCGRRDHFRRRPPTDSVQAGHSRLENLADLNGEKQFAESHQKCHRTVTERRLINPSPKIPHNSLRFQNALLLPHY